MPFGLEALIRINAIDGAATTPLRIAAQPLVSDLAAVWSLLPLVSTLRRTSILPSLREQFLNCNP